MTGSKLLARMISSRQVSWTSQRTPDSNGKRTQQPLTPIQGPVQATPKAPSRAATRKRSNTITTFSVMEICQITGAPLLLCSTMFEQYEKTDGVWTVNTRLHSNYSFPVPRIWTYYSNHARGHEAKRPTLRQPENYRQRSLGRFQYSGSGSFAQCSQFGMKYI